MVGSTVTHRRTTVAMPLECATVPGPCAPKTYERTVAYRHDVPSYDTRAGAHTREELGEQWEPSRRCATVDVGIRLGHRYFPGR